MSQEAEEPSTRKKGRSLVGFYIGLAIAVLLALGVWSAWTPVRVWYWERAFHSADLEGWMDARGGWAPDRSGFFPEDLRFSSGKVEAAEKLAAIGPAARPAVRRLLASGDRHVRANALCGVGKARAVWAIPEVVELCRHERGLLLIQRAFDTISSLTDYKMTGGGIDIPEGEYFQAERQRLLNWWEREGRAKYGRAGE